jgi:hypothetical protein
MTELEEYKKKLEQYLDGRIEYFRNVRRTCEEEMEYATQCETLYSEILSWKVYQDYLEKQGKQDNL